MTRQPPTHPWSQFWAKGGWWRAALLVVAYYALYQGSSLLLLPLASNFGAAGSAQNVLLTIALPILFGCIILVVFGLTTGQLRRVFQRRKRHRTWWMWVAVGTVALFNVLRFASIGYDAVGFSVVLAWLAAGLCIGFAEEVLTRGYVVDLMRRAGNREIAVAAVSAALFAAMHAGNLLSGQSLFVTAFQVLYTFGFGVCMYLTLRVTGSLVWPILLHATTDPSVFLQTEFPAAGALASIAGLGNVAVIAVGLVSLCFIRGRVGEHAEPLAANRE